MRLEWYEEKWKQLLSHFVASGLEAEAWTVFWVVGMVPVARERAQNLEGRVTLSEAYVRFGGVALQGRP